MNYENMLKVMSENDHKGLIKAIISFEYEGYLNDREDKEEILEKIYNEEYLGNSGPFLSEEIERIIIDTTESN